ncbi:hypothetical protein SAMN05216378_4483 [Paenibacillus catalpae]|uniref:Uncharacterized protein n=1 Tax=Paenibacillus catalpae TaxID=1045775 RepID=A0A1I2E9C4_9BACL|nr:hypothetical protein [Paenibacillus catalpae]SFE89277.1 hypothetical protein SAMN05216378_4483 [Paenibacillus catalpae]
MNTITYDHHFNGNEWFVIGLMSMGFAAYWLLPRTLSPLQTIFTMLLSVTFGLIFDHTIAVPPFDLYDVGDRSSYETFDLISYLMYAPYGYLFIYGAERYRISGMPVIGYIILWSGISLMFEWFGIKVGLFHYKHGYTILYSIPIYLVVLSIQLKMYRAAFSNQRWQEYNKNHIQ